MINEILKSIIVKIKFYKKYLKSKNCKLKNQLFIKFKHYLNSISTLQKFSKKKYYTNFISHSINNIKNTWKGLNDLLNEKPNKSNSSTFSSQMRKLIIIILVKKFFKRSPIILITFFLRFLQSHPTEF